jgi:hypothetical protein
MSLKMDCFMLTSSALSQSSSLPCAFKFLPSGTRSFSDEYTAIMPTLPERTLRLHGLRVLELRQDIQQLVVGQEVERRESHALRLEVVLQDILDLVQVLVVLLQRLLDPGEAPQATAHP